MNNDDADVVVSDGAVFDAYDNGDGQGNRTAVPELLAILMHCLLLSQCYANVSLLRHSVCLQGQSGRWSMLFLSPSA